MKQFNHLLLFTLLLSNYVFADETIIRTEMEKKFPYSKVISVSKTLYSGLYEVAFDDRLIYVDEKMNFLFSGNIIDLHTMRNLTESREKQLYAILFDTLPLDLAIKNVKGNGKRRLAVFTDPNCQYCKKLEKELAKLTDTTVYIFVFPILPGSVEKAQSIWCSEDRLTAWEDQMLNGVGPKAEINCDISALEKISEQAKKLRISVTPTLIFGDGVIKPGTLTLEQIEEYFEEAGRTD